MLIKWLVSHSRSDGTGYRAGEVVEVEDRAAVTLIQEGIAEAVSAIKLPRASKAVPKPAAPKVGD